MATPSASEADFIALMKEDDAYARRGVDLLIKHQRFDLFDALEQQGLFSAEHNPMPRGSEKGGYYIPYWHLLDYLKAAAAHSSDSNDLAFAQKVLNVVRTISAAQYRDFQFADNYHTARAFTEILGLVPTDAVERADIDRIGVWIKGRFDRAMVADAINSDVLKRFLESKSRVDWEKAIDVLRCVTQVEWDNHSTSGSGRLTAKGVVDNYTLREIFKNHAVLFGRVAGRRAADVLVERIHEVYSQDLEQRISWLSRPAIEENGQNHSWDGPVDIFVDGLRDVLIGWLASEPEIAATFVWELLYNSAQIVRRIAIYVINEGFKVFRDKIPSLLSPEFFEPHFLHEMYRLLKQRFADFTEPERKCVLDVIRGLKAEGGEDGDIRLLIQQRNWLSAIHGQGSSEADAWFSALQTDKRLPPISSHPDFHSFIEVGWGGGNSPFTVQQLAAFAVDGSLIGHLNAFNPRPNSWREPTARALADALAEAVTLDPKTLLSLLPAFSETKRAYQYGVVAGFRNLWDATKTSDKFDWSSAWPKLIAFFSSVILPNKVWTEPAPEDDEGTPNRNWLLGVVSDFLIEGTRNDDTAFSEKLLPEAWRLVSILVERSPSQMGPSAKDSMTAAINSSKGKAVEAMINCALRMCRVEDRNAGGHREIWVGVLEQAFSVQVEKCKGGNFEFSTLAASNIAQFYYLSSEWSQQNIGRIFPLDYPENCLCALGGLAYGAATAAIYQELLRTGVVDWALRRSDLDDHAREGLLQRIVLGYLWKQEALDGPRFEYLFGKPLEESLIKITSFMWSISNQSLEEEHIERILAFWERCVVLATGLERPPERLLSSLSLLSGYVRQLSEREVRLMKAVAPYVHVNHNLDHFMEALVRLVDQNKEQVCEIFGDVLRVQRPNYDLGGKVSRLLKSLAAYEPTRIQALKFASDLADHIRGMLDLYQELTANPPPGRN